MKDKVLFYFDYDESSGLGHVSRSRAFIEVFTDFGFQIFLTSSLNPIEREPYFTFLRGTHWVSPRDASSITFDFVYIDTYDFCLFDELSKWSVTHKILIIDANFKLEIPKWPDLIVDLECEHPRNLGFAGSYIYGDLLAHSELEIARQDRRRTIKTLDSTSNPTALVNFGGSLKAISYLKRLSRIFLENENISYIVYCPSNSLDNLKSFFHIFSNVLIEPFSSSYFQDLASCDFLITNSGTSFIEGLYVEIPMVVFKLFANAEVNFERLGESKSVLFLGSSPDISKDWQLDVLTTLQSKSNLRTKNPCSTPAVKGLGTTALTDEVNNILDSKKKP